MQNLCSRSLLAAIVACALLATAAPAALADATITSAGPLTTVGATSDLNCYVDHTGDTHGEFYGTTACGTLVATGGTLFGPADIPAGDSAVPRTGFTPVSQTGPTGSGTNGDPYTIVTVVDLGTTGLRITQTDTYVVGEESYRTSVKLQNTGGSTANAIIYRAGDCFLADSDSGFGAHDLVSGSVTCVGSVDDGQGGTMPGTRIESWLPLTSGSHSYHAGFDEVWAKIGSQTAFDDTCRCNEDIDNGAGLSWNVSVPASGSVTVSHLLTFSPAGHLPLSTSKTADAGTAAPGAADGYTITISNPNNSSVALDSITDTLPAGFSYTADSTTGATTANPAINGQDLTWAGPITVPAASGNTPGTASIHFGVTVSSTPGNYFNKAGGTATDYTVVGTGDTAPINVSSGVTYLLSVSKDGTGTGGVTSSPAGINCGGTCSSQFDDGTPVTLTATPQTGSTFTGWSGSGCSGTGTCTVTMDQARSVTATFTLNTYNLSVSRNGSGSGGVTSAPAGISCGATCSTSYAYNTSVTLTATAATGSTFTGWSGSGCSGTGTCTVTMDQARSVTATFTLNIYTLSVGKSGSGTGTVSSSPTGISCGGTCSESFNHGTVVTLTATADSGSTFTGWSGSGCSGTGTCTVTMDQARSVTANFDAVPPPVTHSLTVTLAGTGSGGVTSAPAGINCGSGCSASYNEGTSVTLTATPASGSTFAGWSGDCSGTGTCTVTMNGNHTVTATFTLQQSQEPPVIGPPNVGAGDLFCGAQHRGKCKGLPVKGVFDRPGNASWTFEAFNPNPGRSARTTAAKKVRLGLIKRAVKQAGTVTVVFKLKPGRKTNRLFKQVKKLKLRSVLVTQRFTDLAGKTSVQTKRIKLKF